MNTCPTGYTCTSYVTQNFTAEMGLSLFLAFAGLALVILAICIAVVLYNRMSR